MLTPRFRIDAHLRRTLAGICLTIALLAAVFLVGAVVATAPLSHDEHMYLSAARLLDHGSMYADFSYLQTPYMPYVYNAALKMTGSDYILATARAVKLVIAAALVLVFFGLAARLSSDRWFALACVLILVESDVFRHGLGYARNYDVPMLLVLVGVWVFIALRSHSRIRAAYVSAGFLAGLAIGTKLTYALVPIAFLIPAFVDHRFSLRAVGLTAWFSMGLALGLLPAAYVCLSAGIDRAYFNIIEYHNLNAVWREQTGYTGAMSLIDKLWDARYRLGTLPTQFLLLLALFTGVSIVMSKNERVVTLKSSSVLACIGLVAVSIPMFLIPTPAWKTYYSPFVIWLALLVAAAYPRVPAEKRAAARLLAFGSAFLLLLFQLPDEARLARAAFRAAEWPGIRIHQEGIALERAIPDKAGQRPVATLTPLYALEGGLTIYAELSTGPFAYRIGGLLDAENLKRFHVASEDRIGELMDRRRPSAILVGFQNGLDSRLERYAIENGYEERRDVIPGGRLYIDRRQAAGEPLVPHTVPTTRP